MSFGTSDAPAESGLTGSVQFDGTSAAIETADILDMSEYGCVRVSWWQKFQGTTSGVVFSNSANIDETAGAFTGTCDNNNRSGQGQVVLHSGDANYNLERYINLDGASNDTWEYMVAEIDLLAEDNLDVIRIWKDGEFLPNGEVLMADPPEFFCDGEKFYIGYQPVEGNTRYYTGSIAGLKIEGYDKVAPTIPGDANKDGKVDGSDVTILAGNWQAGVGAPDPSTITWEMGDFNGDGQIDGSDVTILAGNWQAGVTAASTVVPEPSMIVLLLGALASLLVVRRR